MPNRQADSHDTSSAIERARELVAQAVAALDRVRAPSDIAAHLDLAMHRMDALIG